MTSIFSWWSFLQVQPISTDSELKFQRLQNNSHRSASNYPVSVRHRYKLSVLILKQCVFTSRNHLYIALKYEAKIVRKHLKNI